MFNQECPHIADPPSSLEGNTTQRMCVTKGATAEFWREAGIQSFIDEGLGLGGPLSNDSTLTNTSAAESLKGIAGSLKVLFEDFQVYEDPWLPEGCELSPETREVFEWKGQPRCGDTDSVGNERSMRLPLRLTKLVDRRAIQNQREETQRLFSGKGLISPDFTLVQTQSAETLSKPPACTFLSIADCINLQSFVRTLALALPPSTPASAAQGASTAELFSAKASEFQWLAAAASQFECEAQEFLKGVSGDELTLEQCVKALALKRAAHSGGSSISRNPLLESDADEGLGEGGEEGDTFTPGRDSSSRVAESVPKLFALPSVWIVGDFCEALQAAAASALEEARSALASSGKDEHASLHRIMSNALPVRVAPAAAASKSTNGSCAPPQWHFDESAVEGFCKSIRTNLHAELKTTLPFALTAAVSCASMLGSHPWVFGLGSPPLSANFFSSLREIQSEDAASALKHGLSLPGAPAALPATREEQPFISLEANWSRQRRGLRALQVHFREAEKRALQKDDALGAAVASAASCAAEGLLHAAPEQLVCVSLRAQCLRFLFNSPLQQSLALCRRAAQEGELGEAVEGDCTGEQPDESKGEGGPSQSPEEKSAICVKRLPYKREASRGPPRGRRRLRLDVGAKAEFSLQSAKSGVSEASSAKDAASCCALPARRAAADAADAFARQEKWRSPSDATAGKEQGTHRRRFCYVLMEKQNRDTAAALHALAVALRLPPTAVKAAATKDRRAVTTQLVSVAGVDWMRIAAAVSSPAFDRNVQLQLVGYGSSPLHLGHLRGNFFQILVRNVRPAGKAEEPQEDSRGGSSPLPSAVVRHIHAFLESRTAQLRRNGFLNYFGLQRFGTLETKTHKVGVLLLKRDYPAAVKAILSLKIQQAESLRSGHQSVENKSLKQSHKLDAGTAEYSVKRESKIPAERPTTGESGGEHAAPEWISFARFEHLEELLINALDVGASYREALLLLPPASLQLYIHSAQALLFNHLLTYRWNKYGNAACVGDLVVERQHFEGASGASAEFEFFCEDEASNAHLEEGDCALSDFPPSVRVLETVAEAHAAKPADLVLPLMGQDSLLPDYLRTEAEAICVRELGVPLSTFSNSPTLNSQARGARQRQELQRLQGLRRSATARASRRGGKRGLLASELLEIIGKADARERAPYRADKDAGDAPLPVLNLKGGYRKMLIKPELCEWQFALTAQTAEAPPLPLLLNDLDLARRSQQLLRKTKCCRDLPEKEISQQHDSPASTPQNLQHVLSENVDKPSLLSAAEYKGTFGISWDSPLNPSRFLDCRRVPSADPLTVDQVAGSAGRSIVQVADSRSNLALIVRLWLPPGAYCTVALRELMKVTTNEL